MKHRLSATAAVAAVAMLAPGAAAREAKPRTQTLEYVAGGFSAGPGLTMVVTVGDNIGKAVFQGGPERFVSIEVTDSHGLPVTAIVSQGDEENTHYVCGSSDEPLRVKPYRNVSVFLTNGVCGDMGASVVTTGTVTATFTKKG